MNALQSDVANALPYLTAIANKATLIKERLPDMVGHANLYRMEPPLDGHPYVVASAADTFDHGEEVYLFPAEEDGTITDWAELRGSMRGTLNHADALARAGYEE